MAGYAPRSYCATVSPRWRMKPPKSRHAEPRPCETLGALSQFLLGTVRKPPKWRETLASFDTYKIRSLTQGSRVRRTAYSRSFYTPTAIRSSLTDIRTPSSSNSSTNLVRTRIIESSSSPAPVEPSSRTSTRRASTSSRLAASTRSIAKERNFSRTSLTSQHR